MVSKKIIAFTFLIFAGFLLEQNSVLAQSKTSNSIYDAPLRLMLKGDENEDEEAENAILLRETFYPIGWSKDGKFAYYTEPVDEACGCYFASLVIQDLRTDKVLWVHNNANDAFEGEPIEETIETYWKKHQAEFSRKLAEYKIVPQKKFTLLDSPIKYQKDELTAKLEVNLAEEEENVYAVKGKVFLQMISKDKGRKTIYEKSYDLKNLGSLRDAEIGGILLSPFEPRAVIIMAETHRGWEGPPNVTQINIVGASLTTGFR